MLPFKKTVVAALLFGHTQFGCSETLQTGYLTQASPDTSEGIDTNNEIQFELEFAHCPSPFAVVSLGLIDNLPFNPSDMNNSGWIVGSTRNSVNCRPGVWIPRNDQGTSGEFLNLKKNSISFFQSECGEYRLNDANELIGFGPVAELGTNEPEPFYWALGVGAIPLPFELVDINNNGLAIGNSLEVEGSTDELHLPFTWTNTGSIQPLYLSDDTKGHSALHALRINDHSDIVGFSRGTGYGFDAYFRWRAGHQLEFYPNLNGAVTGDVQVLDMNNNGISVGVAFQQGEPRTLVWDFEGVPKDLGHLEFSPYPTPGAGVSINDNNLIIGTDRRDDKSFAWVYCDGAKHSLEDMIEVNGTVVQINKTIKVNRSGMILVSGSVNGQPDTALLLTSGPI